MTAVFASCRFLLLLFCATVVYRTELASAEVRILCESMRNWYPGVAPQSSVAPYVLNVTDEDGNDVHRSGRRPLYNPGQGTYTISLNGTRSGNETETFVGFLIYAKNLFKDEQSGDFLSPFPPEVSSEECHYESTPQWIEVVHNSSSNKEWQSVQIKWKPPAKYPAGDITISASVVNKDGMYWNGINVTLGYMCAVPGCRIPGGCPHGLAKTKFGCETCTCAGADHIGVSIISVLLAFLTVFFSTI